MNRVTRSRLAALGTSALLALTFAPSPAAATPLLRAPDGSADAMSQLSPAAQATLATQVRDARAHNPAIFTAVNSLAGVRPDLYRATRYRRPAVTRELRGLGADALLPMLDVLAVHGYARALDTEERDVLEVGLLEAVGTLRDARAEPVLRAAFLGSPRPAARLAAAQGLGMLCGDAQVALLTQHASDANGRGDAALEGLGRCRRVEAVRPLVAALEGTTAPATLGAASRGLASAGSTWAEQVAANAHLAHDAAVPTMAAQALVTAYARALDRGADEQVRNDLAFAVLAVGHADGPRLLDEAAAHATTPTARTALTALASTARRALARR